MRRHAAFSLVELSIVLVILGLLVGGILAGQSLIRASELRSVSTDLTKYRTAVYAFQDKYFAIPGDFANATSFWGKHSTFCSSAPGSTSSNPTCNGDGDGLIENATQEITYTWQHLALAGLVEGSTAYVVGINPNPGIGSMPSRMSKALFTLFAATPAGATATAGDGNPNRFQFGAPCCGTLRGPALRPEETWNLDTKLDDGVSNSGKFLGGDAVGGSGLCLSGSSYQLSNTGLACFFDYTL